MKKNYKKFNFNFKKINDKYNNNIYLLIVFKVFKKNFYKKNIDMNNKEEIIYLEIRSGIGGDESCMFVKDIYKMYTKYFINNYIIYEIIHKKKGKKGLKRIILRIKKKNIYNKFFFESGVHRVQRIPKNDFKKRMHTSTCVVEVFKEYNEKSITFKRKDLKIDTFKSSGAGGQSVNKTNSAVRITHLPTGIKVECQKERSQMENKRFAIKLLVSKLKDIEKEKNDKEKNNKRNNYFKYYSIRSSKIRTYNYSRNVIKDHFLKKNFSNLKNILKNGRIDKIFSKNKLIK
ncbi:peptide chain release factor-like protein [Candidatus Vidania fulgoroideorum]